MTAIGLDKPPSSARSIAVGDKALVVNAVGGIAFGAGSYAEGDGAMAIGYMARAVGRGAVAIGDYVEAMGDGVVRIRTESPLFRAEHVEEMRAMIQQVFLRSGR